MQRRARLMPASTHFSYTSPLPIPFPYRLVAPDPPQQGDAQGAYVERWLTAQEPLEPVGELNVPGSALSLDKWSSDKRSGRRQLLGVAPAGVRDCLPNLDIGDAFEVIGKLALSDCRGSGAVEGENAARQELVDVLGGKTVLFAVPPNGPDTNQSGYAPWSLRYSGHQFGNWAGQLGDGRAISILETPHPDDAETTYELQLKGAGRTPFSRGADGLAVLRSSIREYLCGEAMHALRIPTTRSLALIGLPDLEVVREEYETACILTRVAPSFIRIGNFQALNPPTDIFLLGGGQQPADYDALRLLGLWVARRVLRLPDLEDGKPWALRLVKECAKRNALMLAGWQAYGFMHGVMNTDNISILGLTIDYGPYAFMDVYDAGHVCNHSDDEGRYAFKYQPTMITFALRKLLEALAPLIGAEEAAGKAADAGWAAGVSEDELKKWREAGLKHQNDVDLIIQDVFIPEYMRLMCARFGLSSVREGDLAGVINPFLDLVHRHEMDFHATFRALAVKLGDISSWSPSTVRVEDIFVSPVSPKPSATARQGLQEWLALYHVRRTDDDAGATTMLNVNPRFVLRQWVLEEVIKRVSDDAESGRRVLAKILHMAEHPFEPWGGEGKDEAEISVEEQEERRMCGLGEKGMLGFQCSCSS